MESVLCELSGQICFGLHEVAIALHRRDQWDNFGMILGSFLLDFRIILGAFLDIFERNLGSFWDYLHTLRTPWGFLGSLGGSLEAPLVHPRLPLGSQAARGVLPGIFREFSGRFRDSFWLHYGSILKRVA